MNIKEDYQEKIEAEIELTLAKLTELKVQARTFAADASIKYSKQIDTLEQEIVTIRTKVKEMAASSEDSWEQLKHGLEHGWIALNSTVQDAVAENKKILRSCPTKSAKVLSTTGLTERRLSPYFSNTMS